VLGFFMLLVSVPIAGYEGFVCFGSWLAVITCVGAWLPVAVAGILLIFGGTELLARGAVRGTVALEGRPLLGGVKRDLVQVAGRALPVTGADRSSAIC